MFLDRHLIVRSFTPAVAAIYNLIPSDAGRPLTDIVNRLKYHRLREDVSQVLRTLQPLERRVVRDDERAHYLLRILPYRAPDSTVSGTLVSFLDVTTIVEAERHHRLMVDEFNHRVKNMLTVVMSLASQTLRRSTSMHQFAEAFMGRVQALTASYTLLNDQNWRGVPLLSVLVEETKPYVVQDRGNIVLEGPAIDLTPAAALAFGMAIHELATNAVKYGALSVAEGTVTVTWRFEDHAQVENLVLEWREQNGPAVEAPTRRGFGSTLIERGFAHELSGSATIGFEPSGLRAVLMAPRQTTAWAPVGPELELG